MELTAAPMTDPAMPMREARSMEVAAAADAAMAWATEMPSNSPFLMGMGCVPPICVSVESPLPYGE